MRTVTYPLTIVQDKACKYKVLRRINLNDKDTFEWKNKYKRKKYPDLKQFPGKLWYFILPSSSSCDNQFG